MISYFQHQSKGLIVLFCLVFCLVHQLQAQTDSSHHVPLQKHINRHLLLEDGPRSFTGKQLTTIGMPCGGIASGQLYVRGDGTLACWWIANNAYNTGYGAASTNNFNTVLGPWKDCYQTFEPFSYIEQGFTLNGRPLDSMGFDAISFTGEYPVATIDYHDRHQPHYRLRLKVFSPFIPLDARESATPGTVLQYFITNTAKTRQTFTLAGRLQNPVGLDGKGQYTGTSRNRAVIAKGLTGIFMDITNSSLPETHPWNGNVCLSVTGKNSFTSKDTATALGTPLVSSVGRTFALKPGESTVVTFLLTWYFPNRPHYIDTGWTKPLQTGGPLVYNNYKNWFSSSLEVAQWLSRNLPRLEAATMAFRDAYYDQSTLPYWLNRRLLMPLSTLATETCQWWGNGKFYAWEGVGSCVGTCTHVWNYEQAMAHLFPELERSVREQTDFADSFLPDGGILTRDGHKEYGLELDGQAGTVLKAYREYLQGKDNSFLTDNWPRIKAAMHFLIYLDKNREGLIRGVQPNTYDIAFYGANTYVGSLYLGALKAAEKMARLMHDPFADSCALIAERGSVNSSVRLFNGEYFIQDVDLKVHPDWQYGKGCLSDQLFGQTWAGLYGLGDLYPKQEILSALKSIWVYNWAPDVGVQNRYHLAERDYADPGEAGLLVCTWPHGPHPGNKGVRYRDEVWTGIEYQVATCMIENGMLDEGLSILKGLDSRYQPEKHNPWNEIECGDHYARAMASYGVLLALQGLQYDGPERSLSFAPKLEQDHFRSFFAGAEGWGDISQERDDHKQTDRISISYGMLPLKTLSVGLPDNGAGIRRVTVTLDNKPVAFDYKTQDGRLTITLPGLVIKEKQQLKLEITK